MSAKFHQVTPIFKRLSRIPGGTYEWGLGEVIDLLSPISIGLLLVLKLLTLSNFKTIDLNLRPVL